MDAYRVGNSSIVNININAWSRILNFYWFYLYSIYREGRRTKSQSDVKVLCVQPMKEQIKAKISEYQMPNHQKSLNDHKDVR